MRCVWPPSTARPLDHSVDRRVQACQLLEVHSKEVDAE
jgi:hypothetical protein